MLKSSAAVGDGHGTVTPPTEYLLLGDGSKAHYAAGIWSIGAAS